MNVFDNVSYFFGYKYKLNLPLRTSEINDKQWLFVILYFFTFYLAYHTLYFYVRKIHTMYLQRSGLK